MLTKHNYQPLPQNWDEDRIRECCTNESSDDPICTDCCYDTWREEQKEVNKTYNRALEEAAQLQKLLGFVIERRNKLKTWLDELDKTEDLARRICNQLEILAVQSDKIWYNACRAVEAIEILFCMIRDFFMQVDYLKTRYEDLQICINKNTDPALVKDQGILKCLKEYAEKLEAVIKTRDEIIKAILEAIKLANLVRNSISTRVCSTDYDPCNPGQPCACTDNTDYTEHSDRNTESEYGFKTIICEWYCSFECDEECGQPSKPGGPQQQKSMSGRIQGQQPTDETVCELLPMFDFPICNDSYRDGIRTKYERDEARVNELSNQVKEISKKKESLLACKLSLDKAIAEVDPKIRCK